MTAFGERTLYSRRVRTTPAMSETGRFQSSAKPTLFDPTRSLKPFKKPPSRGARRRVFPVHGEHGDRGCVRMEGFEPQGHEVSGVEVILDHCHRHMAPSEPGAQKCMLGAQIGESPYLWREDAESLAFR